MAIIKESFFLTASNADILAAPSRLAAIPRAGILGIECSASDCDGTNYGTLTLQMPDGDIPFEDLAVPAWHSTTATDAVLDNNTELSMQLEVQQGGHIGLAYTENGTVALCFIMFTLTF